MKDQKLEERAVNAAVGALNIEDKVKQKRREKIQWEPPIPFFTHQLPSFPADTLPDWVREWVKAEAMATQTPHDLAGLLVLCAIAIAGARKAEIQIRSGWREPLNLYGIAGLDPANRKSAVFRDATVPIEDQEKKEAEAMKDEIVESRTLREVLEKKLEHAKKEAAKAEKKKDQDKWTQTAIALAKELEETPVLVEPRYVADDCTPEKLGSLLATHQSRMGIFSAEGDIFDTIAGRYNQGQPNIGVFLKAHSGDDLRVDRVGRPSEFILKPALTLTLTVQLSVIQGLASKPGFRGRGLLARILYVLPESPIGRRDTKPPSLPSAIRTTYHRNITKLLTLPWRKDGQPHVLQFSKEATELFDDFHKIVEAHLSDFGELGNMRDWGGKLMGAVARLAGNLHLAENVDQDTPWNTPVTGRTMQHAIRLGKYFARHAKAAYAEMGADPEVENARYILRWLQRHQNTPVTKRNIHQGTKGRFKKIDQLEPGLKILLDHEYLKQRVDSSATARGAGQPPSPKYDVNPNVFNETNNSEDNENIGDKEPEIPSPHKNESKTPKPSSQFPLFPEHGLEHAHEFVADKSGKYSRCKNCGEFQKKGGDDSRD